MAKVTIQMVTDAGFRAEQFGTPADFAITAGYIDRIIDDAEVWATDAVGDAVYAAATAGIGKLRLARAELCFVKAQLWRARAAFIDSNAQSALEGSNGVYLERREFLKHADEAEQCADYWLLQFTTTGQASSAGSGLAMGHVETGPFPVTAETA